MRLGSPTFSGFCLTGIYRKAKQTDTPLEKCPFFFFFALKYTISTEQHLLASMTDRMFSARRVARGGGVEGGRRCTQALVNWERHSTCLCMSHGFKDSCNGIKSNSTAAPREALPPPYH